MVGDAWTKRFVLDVRIRRVVFGRLGGSRFAIVASSSVVVDDAGRGRHSVGGSERPGKVSNKTLTTGSMIAVLFDVE